MKIDWKLMLINALAAMPFAVGICLALPVFLMFGFGSDGGDPGHGMRALAIGFLFYLVCAFIGLFKKKFLYGCIIGIAIIIVGNTLDARFWKKHNQALCQQLRADPLCKEDASGFSCDQKSSLGGFSASIRICNQ